MPRTTPRWPAVLIVFAAASYFLWTHQQAQPTSPPTPSPATTAAQAGPAPRTASPSTSPTLRHPRVPAIPTAQTFSDLKHRAKNGDAVAQRLLAQAYDACFMVNIAPETFIRDYVNRTKLLSDPKDAERMLEIAHDWSEACRDVDGGAIIPSDLVKGWFAQAAENGDLAAQSMHNALSQQKLDEAASLELVGKVLASGDPAAVFMFGNTVGGYALPLTETEYAGLVDGPNASYAWMIAGCRMGYDCAPGSLLMGHVCLFWGSCTGEDFETAIRSSLPTDTDRQQLDERIEQISRLTKAQ